MENSFKLFEDYSLCVKKALEVNLSDDSMNDEDKVQVIYGTPPLSFAKYLQYTINGQKPGPLITFYLSGIEISKDEALLGYNKMTIDNKYVISPPIICSLNYTVTINCINETQGDLLIAQSLMAMPFMRPYYTTLDSQYVCMVADDPENLTTIESGDATEKLARRQFKLTIQRAYLQYPVREIKKFIKEFNVYYNSIGGVTIGDKV